MLPLHHQAIEVEIVAQNGHKVKLVAQILKKWAFIYNATKPGTRVVADELKALADKLGLKAKIFKGAPESLKGFDAAASIGGDGTLLGCVPAALKAGIPLVGVNMGKLGYLACLSKDNLAETFPQVVAGKFKKLERCLIEVTFGDGKKALALNDVVLKSADFRLAELKVSVDGEPVAEYGCDGLIFSTPTGSTAYNLSAGGPVVDLRACSIVMTPICPHSFSSRSVIFNAGSKLTVEHLPSQRPVHINVDGRFNAEGCNCLPLTVKIAKEKLITLENPRLGNFEVLREKLGWK